MPPTVAVPCAGPLAFDQVSVSPSASVASSVGALHPAGEPSSSIVTATLAPWLITGLAFPTSVHGLAAEALCAAGRPSPLSVAVTRTHTYLPLSGAVSV